MPQPVSPLDRIPNLQEVPTHVAQKFLDRLATRIPKVIANLQADEQRVHDMCNMRLY